MRKVEILLLIGFMSLTFLATSAPADMLVTDVDPPDTNALYWTGSDINPGNNLNNSNPVTEEAWLEALLGKVYNDPTVNFIKKIEWVDDGPNKIIDFDPGFAWEWAVVKYAGYWAAYVDTDNNNFLSTGQLSHGVSHVTFFGGQPIPEPATMLLLGSGLIGLAGVARRRFRK